MGRLKIPDWQLEELPEPTVDNRRAERMAEELRKIEPLEPKRSTKREKRRLERDK